MGPAVEKGESVRWGWGRLFRVSTGVTGLRPRTTANTKGRRAPAAVGLAGPPLPRDGPINLNRRIPRAGQRRSHGNARPRCRRRSLPTRIGSRG